MLPKGTDLAQYNSRFLHDHNVSPAHVQASTCVRHFLEPKTFEENQKDILRTLALDSVTLKDAIRGLEILNAWKTNAVIHDDYISAAHERWPEATAFKRKGT